MRVNVAYLGVGVSLVVTSVCTLLYVYAFASMVDPVRPDYWVEVLRRMYRLYDPGIVTYAASVFLLVGLVLSLCGVFGRAIKRTGRKKGQD